MVRGVGRDHWSAPEFARTLGLMTKGKRKRKRPGGGGSSQVAASPEAALAELDARIGEIRASDSADAGPLWGAVHKLLLKAKADPAEVTHIIAARDTDALARLVRILRGEEPEPASGENSAEVEADYSDIAPDLLKEAMRAFRKRIKLIRLDHESKLGVGPMTGGRIADFDAILPPQEFSRRVWEALVAAGKLERAGQGFYMLPESEKAPDLPR